MIIAQKKIQIITITQNTNNYSYYQFFTRKEFAITKALLKIIAKAAKIGLNLPLTAKPIPIML